MTPPHCHIRFCPLGGRAALRKTPLRKTCKKKKTKTTKNKTPQNGPPPHSHSRLTGPMRKHTVGSSHVIMWTQKVYACAFDGVGVIFVCECVCLYVCVFVCLLWSTMREKYMCTHRCLFLPVVYLSVDNTDIAVKEKNKTKQKTNVVLR